jgi:hypothetical protein
MGDFSMPAARIARAMRKAARHHAQQAGPGRYLATVVRWESHDDFALDVHGEDLELDDDDVTLGQSVRRYDRDVGVAQGDDLVLIEIADDEYVAVEVASDSDAS